MARPKLSDSDRRSDAVMVRLSISEGRTLRHAAARMGKGASTWIREMALKAASRAEKR